MGGAEVSGTFAAIVDPKLPYGDPTSSWLQRTILFYSELYRMYANREDYNGSPIGESSVRTKCDTWRACQSE